MKKLAKSFIAIVLTLILCSMAERIPAVNNLVVEKNFDFLKAAISLAAGGIVWLVSKAGDRNPSAKNVLMNKYSEYLTGAFEGAKNAGKRRTLISAVKDYDGSDYDSAIKKLEELLPRCTDDRDYCTVQSVAAIAYYKKGQTDKAVEAGKAAAERGGTRAELWYRLGAFQMAAGKAEEAVESWKKEMKYSPSSSRPYVNIANLRLNQKKYEEAVEYAQKAVKINYREREPYRILCIAFHVLGDEEKSRECYGKFRNFGGKTAALDAELNAVKK